MAKPITQKIKLLSTAGTGFFYVTKKNPRTATEKLSFKKYDPIARKHVAFKETKIKYAGRSPGPFSRRAIVSCRLSDIGLLPSRSRASLLVTPKE